MPHYVNIKTQAVHCAAIFGSAKFLCSVSRTDKFVPTKRAITCTECKHKLKPGTKHHITHVDDPVYDLTEEIGADLSDGAFWALYEELGR